MEVLREEIIFLEEQLDESQAQNQQEAQKNVLSEQFNDKLMNEYEELSVQFEALQQENQMLAQANGAVNS